MSPHMPVVEPLPDPPGTVSPEQFGAVGDGETDDTVALQAALDAGAGSVIYLHPGKTYMVDEITATLDDLTVMGYGATISKFSATGNVMLRVLGDRFTIEGATLNAGGRSCYLVRVNVDGAAPTAVDRFTARRVTFDCDHRTAKGIFVGFYDNATIADCYLENLLADDDVGIDANTAGITLHAGDLQTSKNAIVKHNTIVGFYTGIESFGTGIRQFTLLDGNTVKSCTSVGIYNYRGAQARVRGNFVTSCVGGIFADSSNAADLSSNLLGNSVDGNVVRLCTSYGILLEEHQGGSVVGNTCSECRDGIVIGGGTADVTVSGNNCTKNSRYGIWSDKSLNPVQTHSYDVAVVGNVCKLNGEDGIRLGGIKRGLVVSGNHCCDNGTTAASLGASTFAGIRLGANTGAETTQVVIVGNNVLGNNIGAPAGTGEVGKQGYGLLLDTGVVTHVIVQGNVFSGNGQFNIRSSFNTLAILGNVFRDGTNSLPSAVVTSDGNQGGGMGIRTQGTAAPATGTWAIGDIVFNTAPTAGGTIGWVCTTAGTPGTWKTFGAIAA